MLKLSYAVLVPLHSKSDLYMEKGTVVFKEGVWLGGIIIFFKRYNIFKHKPNLQKL
jgi:hypothetical protein